MIVGVIAYPAIRIANTYDALLEYSFAVEPDQNEFQSVNYTRLTEVANWTDRRYQEYHMPLNRCGPAYLTNKSFTR